MLFNFRKKIIIIWLRSSIKCRVIWKDEIRRSTNSKDPCKSCFLNFNLADENGEINAVAFSQDDCERFNRLLELHKVSFQCFILFSS